MRYTLEGVSANIEDRRFDDSRVLTLKRAFERAKDEGREERTMFRRARADPNESVASRRVRLELEPLSRGLTTRRAGKAKAALRRYRRTHG